MNHVIFTVLRVPFSVLLLLLCAAGASAQQVIRGTITDESAQPIPYANIFIKETLEGASSDEDGVFSFRTSATGATATLCAMVLGYQEFSMLLQLPLTDTIAIRMRPSNVALDEVEVIASSFQLNGSSQWKKMGAVDLVTTGGSVGDLYKSIATLPGTQANAESGKLFIRGGESREAQTYIDDMHVLVPYTTTGENEPVRGRYSPFMFEGMNFSLGGYDPEYAQGLSSVLPLTTKDESPISKYGVSATSVGLGGGGTKAFTDGSASLNIDYQDLCPYYSVFTDPYDWITPYRRFSGGSQFRYEPTASSLVKLYAGYDRTRFSYRQDADYPFRLKENNYYLNSTYRNQLAGGYHLFGGAAFSYLDQHVNGALTAGDRAETREWEAHLKAKLSKRYSTLFRLQAGMESMIRYYRSAYDAGTPQAGDIGHSINAAFATGSFHLTGRLNAALSSRVEYTTLNRQWNYMPRLAFNYDLTRDVYLSAIAGRYSQLTDDDYLLRNRRLPAESCWHYILGAYHQRNHRVYRLEVYDKEYDKLTCVAGKALNASGNGYSRGLDAFFYDAALVDWLEYRLSYSLNYSKRKYRDYPVKDIPQFASRHNVSLSLRCNVSLLKSIVGVTNRYASGRPYHDPQRDGYMNGRAPHYNSLDLSWTFLANKKLIIFASASNILGRNNVYNYTSAGEAMAPASKNFFFIGFFITLGGNTAYDVSNF